MKNCPKCGAPADGIFCLSCGAAVNSEPAAPTANDFKGDAPQQPQQPAQPAQPQQPYYPPQPPVQQPYYPEQPPVQESSGLATAAIVLAIFLPLVGMIVGAVARKKYQSPELQKRCTTAITIGAVMLALSFILQFVGTL